MQRVTNAKLLGVIVDQHPNIWNTIYVSMVSQKKSGDIISRILNTLDIKSKKNIY